MLFRSDGFVQAQFRFGGGYHDDIGQWRQFEFDGAVFIAAADLSRDRDEQRPERFSVGQVVDAR